MEYDFVRLSKAVARALRHEPWLYELEIDEEGWTPVKDLLAALRRERHEWCRLTKANLEEMIARSDKQRYEIQGRKIRALYGHSLPGKLAKTPAQPPATLYHGTTTRVLDTILAEGLRPMSRQYVHLSSDTVMAQQVGRRKKGHTVILAIQAGEAYQDGLVFYAGNERVWLADHIPAQYIRVEAYL